MDWDRYKQLCDQPNVVSRWMLEQTLELLAGNEVAAILSDALAGRPLPKPVDHRGGEATDMYVLDLRPGERATVVRLVRHAQEAGLVTSGTTARGLGGFVEAWGEYLEWDESRSQTAPTNRMDRENFMADEKSVVLELIDGFNNIDLDRIVACFADGAVYHNMPMEAVTGPDAIRQVLQGFMGSASEVQWDLLNIAADGGVVMTERVDKFKINDTWIALPVMGTFEVSNGKITAWRDYFDLNQFQEQFAKASGGQ